MGLIVQKYGGSSVADLDRIREVARWVARCRARGPLVVVASAMAGETDRLLALARGVAGEPDRREQDVLAASGEQVSVALLAIALKAMGCPARSFLAHQVPICTDSAFGQARVCRVEPRALLASLERGEVPVVAGFQGVDPEGNLTTLGRGGSDTTAVAIAAALRAELCEIYTDVEGVYTADPGICPDARRLERLSYEEMLELASLGAKVLHPRAVELAMKYGVPLHVRSSLSWRPGTWVMRGEQIMEQPVVSGVTCDRDQAKLTVMGVPDRPGIAARIFSPISRAGLVVDMIVQNVGTDGRTDLTFTVSRADVREARRILEGVAAEIGARGVEADSHVAKVSLVGLGMRGQPGVAARAFEALAREGINILMISTSEIKISCVIEDKYAELAVRVLHEAFGLGGNDAG